MGLFSFLSKRPEKKDITAYNYYLNFDYIPKKLYDWGNKRCSFNTVISFDSLIQKNPIWRSLIKKTDVTSSGVNRYPNLKMYLIKGPSTEFMGEVAVSIIAINQETRKYLFYTLEYSIGCFMICSSDEKGNHVNYGSCDSAEQFAAFALKKAMEKL